MNYQIVKICSNACLILVPIYIDCVCEYVDLFLQILIQSI